MVVVIVIAVCECVCVHVCNSSRGQASMYVIVVGGRQKSKAC